MGGTSDNGTRKRPPQNPVTFRLLIITAYSVLRTLRAGSRVAVGLRRSDTVAWSGLGNVSMQVPWVCDKLRIPRGCTRTQVCKYNVRRLSCTPSARTEADGEHSHCDDTAIRSEAAAQGYSPTGRDRGIAASRGGAWQMASAEGQRRKPRGPLDWNPGGRTYLPSASFGPPRSAGRNPIQISPGRPPARRVSR